MAKETDVLEPKPVQLEPKPVQSMGKPPQRQRINCHHMEGDMRGLPCTTPDPHVLHISANDQAEWGSEGKEFTIDFKSHSPFQESVFKVPAGGVKCSGPITGEPGTYKYSLENHRGVVNDPTIIIQQ